MLRALGITSAMTRLIPDRFVLLLLGALAVAWLVPVRGAALMVAQNVIFIGIFLLFFLHGLRLPRAEVAKAAKGWRVQAAMLLFCFVAMPVFGLIVAKLSGSFLPPALVAGLIYVAILPSTVQSAISYSAIAGGAVAASVVGAAVSNLAGIVVTPVLAAVLIGGAAGVAIDANVVVKIATMLLLPFALGQLAQSYWGAWAQRQNQILSVFDRGVILLAVYIAFAGAVTSGALAQLDTRVAGVMLLSVSALLGIAFAGAMLLGRGLGLERADQISLLFAGAHKSIATGAPMAALLFGAEAGLILLPAIAYHMVQLVVSAPVASRISKLG